MAVENLYTGGVMSRFEVGPEDIAYLIVVPNSRVGGIVVIQVGRKEPYLVWLTDKETGGGQFVPVEIPEAAKSLAPGKSIKLDENTPLLRIG